MAAGLDVIFCVGETQEERGSGQTEAVLDRQIIKGLAGVKADRLDGLIIAYEPVWAIGNTGHQATPQQAQEATLSFAATSARCSEQKMRSRFPFSRKSENDMVNNNSLEEHPIAVGRLSMHGGVGQGNFSFS